jgi:hypothetical protein
MLIMDGNGPLCLACADLDHLAFLPAGNTALTRRAKRAGGLSAVVVRFSRAPKRYERQGILIEATTRIPPTWRRWEPKSGEFFQAARAIALRRSLHMQLLAAVAASAVPPRPRLLMNRRFGWRWLPQSAIRTLSTTLS